MNNMIPKLPGIGKGAPAPRLGGGANTDKGGLEKLQIKPMIKSFNDFRRVHFAPQAGLRLNLK